MGGSSGTAPSDGNSSAPNMGGNHGIPSYSTKFRPESAQNGQEPNHLGNVLVEVPATAVIEVVNFANMFLEMVVQTGRIKWTMVSVA